MTTRVLTADQMRATEAAAIESGAVTGATLMERAGEAVVTAILTQGPALRQGAHRALVLCGPGNNGGDGFVVARLLRARGWEVAVAFYGRADRLPPDARRNHDRLTEVSPFSAETLMQAGRDADALVVVDALFGIGLSRPLPQELTGPWEAAVKAGLLAQKNLHLVAVDLPSGWTTDDAQNLGTLAGFDGTLAPVLTVTFHAMKPVHPVLREAGQPVVVASIGL